MRFNKLALVGLLALAVLAGCSSSPKKTPKASAETDTNVPVEAGSSLLPPGPVLPNPYLQAKPSVSRQVAQNFADATRAMEQKQWGQAESLLQRVIAENKQLSGAWLNLGFVYRAQNDDKRAEDAFNQAINANHTNLDAYNALAILKREAGDFAAAEDNYKKALSIWPWHPDSHKNIAILYDLYMGKGEEALAHYEAYQTLVGDGDKNINSWIADLQRRLGIKPKPKAAPAAETSSAISETSTDASSDESTGADGASEETGHE